MRACRLAAWLAAGLLALAGCTDVPKPHAPAPSAPSSPARSAPAPAGSPSPTVGSPLPRYQTITQLLAVLSEQLRTDRTASFTDDATVNAQPPIQFTGAGTLRLDNNVLSAQTHQQFHTPGASSSDLWVVLVPGMGYFRVPPQVTGLPPGRSWIAVPPDDPAGADGAARQFGPLLDAVRQSIDPSQPLRPYGDAVSLVESAPVQLGPTPTVRYLVRVDVARGQLSTPDAELKDVLGELLSAGSPTVELRLWLDSGNRLVQLAGTVPVPAARTTVATRVRYSRWGSPVTITAPPSDQLAR